MTPCRKARSAAAEGNYYTSMEGSDDDTESDESCSDIESDCNSNSNRKRKRKQKKKKKKKKVRSQKEKNADRILAKSRAYRAKQIEEEPVVVEDASDDETIAPASNNDSAFDVADDFDDGDTKPAAVPSPPTAAPSATTRSKARKMVKPKLSKASKTLILMFKDKKKPTRKKQFTFKERQSTFFENAIVPEFGAVAEEPHSDQDAEPPLDQDAKLLSDQDVEPQEPLTRDANFPKGNPESREEIESNLDPSELKRNKRAFLDAHRDEYTEKNDNLFADDDAVEDEGYCAGYDMIFTATGEVYEEPSQSVFGEDHNIEDDDPMFHQSWCLIRGDEEDSEDYSAESSSDDEDDLVFDDGSDEEDDGWIKPMKIPKGYIPVGFEDDEKRMSKRQKKMEENHVKRVFQLLDQVNQGAKSSKEINEMLDDDDWSDDGLDDEAEEEAYDGYVADSYESSDDETGGFKLVLEPGKKRIVKPMPARKKEKHKNRANQKRFAGELPLDAIDAVDNESKLKMNIARPYVDMAQQMCMPLVMQQSYQPPENLEDEDEARKKERRMPKLIFGTFLYTEQAPNDPGGKGNSGNWLTRPQIHFYTGSDAAKAHLQASIESTATRWNMHGADWAEFVAPLFPGKVPKEFRKPRSKFERKEYNIAKGQQRKEYNKTKKVKAGKVKQEKDEKAIKGKTKGGNDIQFGEL